MRASAPGSTNNAAPLFFNGIDVSERTFLRRRYVFAIVNNRPVVDGHVLICPVRQVRTMRDLTELEYLELFTCAREVAAKFQQAYHLTNYSFVMHDGELAGDDVPGGLCLQAIPGGSAPVNKISVSKVERSLSAMQKEAEDYSVLFQSDLQARGINAQSRIP